MAKVSMANGPTAETVAEILKLTTDDPKACIQALADTALFSIREVEREVRRNAYLRDMLEAVRDDIMFNANAEGGLSDRIEDVLAKTGSCRRGPDRGRF